MLISPEHLLVPDSMSSVSYVMWGFTYPRDNQVSGHFESHVTETGSETVSEIAQDIPGGKDEMCRLK